MESLAACYLRETTELEEAIKIHWKYPKWKVKAPKAVKIKKPKVHWNPHKWKV